MTFFQNHSHSNFKSSCNSCHKSIENDCKMIIWQYWENLHWEHVRIHSKCWTSYIEIFTVNKKLIVSTRKISFRQWCTPINEIWMENYYMNSHQHFHAIQWIKSIVPLRKLSCVRNNWKWCKYRMSRGKWVRVAELLQINFARSAQNNH